MARRTSHKLIGLNPQGVEARVNVRTSGGVEDALRVAEEHGWTLVEPWRPQRLYDVDKARLAEAIEAAGIEWPVTVRVHYSAEHKGRCVTNFGTREHRITICPDLDTPDRTLWHELGHAADDEQRFARVGGNARAAAASMKAEARMIHYRDRPCEVTARSYEEFAEVYPIVRMRQGG